MRSCSLLVIVGSVASSDSSRRNRSRTCFRSITLPVHQPRKDLAHHVLALVLVVEDGSRQTVHPRVVRLEEIFNFSLCHTYIIQFRAGKCKAKEPVFSNQYNKVILFWLLLYLIPFHLNCWSDGQFPFLTFGDITGVTDFEL